MAAMMGLVVVPEKSVAVALAVNRLVVVLEKSVVVALAVNKLVVVQVVKSLVAGM